VTYVGDGETSASVLAARDQLSRPGVGSVVATGSQTAGDFGLFRGTMAAGSEIAPHFHRTFSESFYVLTGRIELWDGGAWSPAGAGDLVHVPRGGVHGLRVTNPEGAEVLTLFTPGIPRERFVLELLEIRTSGRELTHEEWAEFYRRHDQYMVEPPTE
jgi:quercetin dioxygenase-like cupin family protein